MADGPSWQRIGVGSWLGSRPAQPVSAVLRSPDLLPTDQLGWEDFERLQWRVLREVEGLGTAFLYGSRGQAQSGLDIVAVSPGEPGVALQSKGYAKFQPAHLRAAVQKFQDTERPFDIDRLIIGVSRLVTSTKVQNELIAQQRKIHPVALELWDQRELSQLLRDQPEIVMEFFSHETARAFCVPFEEHIVIVPAADAVVINEALARTPEVATGADHLLNQARECADNEPQRALSLLDEARDLLVGAGFPAHAAAHDDFRIELLTAHGREEHAARSLLDDVWTALDSGSTLGSQEAHRKLNALSRTMADSRPAASKIQAMASATELAIDLHDNPLGQIPEVPDLADIDPVDLAVVILIAGEIALANDDRGWLEANTTRFATAIDGPGVEHGHRVRMRLLLAETTDQWASLLKDARRGQLGHAYAALVAARYARRCALQQEFEEADLQWEEAAGEACLSKSWDDASDWILSRRAFRVTWAPFTDGDLLKLQLALRGRGPSQRIMPLHETAREDALASLHAERLRSAAISAQRALRDAVITGNWHGETEGRKLLADILTRSGEPQLAAHHLTRAASNKGVAQLASSQPSVFIDVTDDLDAPNYWTVGTAFQLIAHQADLVPDDLVEPIADHIAEELDGAANRTLPDLRFMASSRYRGALKALAGLSDRLTPSQAEHALTHFEEQPAVEPDHYRYHDEDEAIAVAKIGRAHDVLRTRALNHLVSLLSRSQTSRNSQTLALIDEHRGEARPQLEALAETDPWAREMLAFHDPDSPSQDAIDAAMSQLTTPRQHTPGMYTTGTNAIENSLVVRGQPQSALVPAMREMLNRANDPQVGSSDRGEYLLAASNLAAHLHEDDRAASYPRALTCATDPVPSEQDDLEASFTHPLGGLRMSAPLDARAKAAYLASLLATTTEEKTAVRQAAFSLLSNQEDSDYWITRTLQELGDALDDDLGFLAGQGWALRSLAAIVWARTSSPAHIGLQLANDPDVRVRRALATQLAMTEADEAQQTVRKILADDPCYSVRTALLRSDS
jgi:hypothetical protein